MNNSEVAKNGFKTFLLTLTLSLVLFSVVYYLATDTAPDVDIEAGSAAEFVESLPEPTVPASETVTEDVPHNPEELVAAQVQVSADAPVSAFSDISRRPLDVDSQKVLGAGDIGETTQSTVPATATLSVTYAFIITVSTVLVGFYLMISSKKKALVSFENRVKRD
jgi:hypothetical protein